MTSQLAVNWIITGVKVAIVEVYKIILESITGSLWQLVDRMYTQGTVLSEAENVQRKISLSLLIMSLCM